MPQLFLILLACLLVQTTALANDSCPDCRGYSAEIAYTGELWRNTSGGLKTDGTYLDDFGIVLNAASGSLGIPGLSGNLFVLHNNANNFSAEIVGDLQTVSNIDTPKAWRLYEAWFEWSPAQTSLFSVRAGIYAADQEFDAAPTAGLFLNSAAGTGTEYASAGVTGPPIFPITGFGVRFAGSWGDDGYWLAAVMDGIPGNPDDITDFYYRWNSDDGALLQTEFGIENFTWNKLAFGIWTYSTEKETLRADSEGNPETAKWDTGIYAIADRLLISGERGDVSGYLRVGATKEGFINRGRFNAITRFVGAGLAWSRFLPGREQDELGFYVAAAFAGDELRQARIEEGLATDRHETVLELTYRFQVTDWFSVQPDIQYVINPGLEPDLDNALVVGVRFSAGIARQW